MIKLSTLFKYLGYAILFIVATALTISPFIDVIGNKLPAHTWIGIFCGVLSSFVIYFVVITDNYKEDIISLKKDIGTANTKLTELQSKGQFFGVELSEAIKYGFQNCDKLKKVRIYASTSQVIFNIIRDIEKDMVDCSVLLQTFNSSGFSVNPEKLNDRVKSMMEAWQEYQSHGRVENVEIILYNRYPSDYFIILNDKYLIWGKYMPDDKSSFGSQYTSPIVFSGSDEESKKLIANQIVWFDKTFNYFKDHKNEITI